MPTSNISHCLIIGQNSKLFLTRFGQNSAKRPKVVRHYVIHTFDIFTYCVYSAEFWGKQNGLKLDAHI